jgi:hypothetical protein
MESKAYKTLVATALVALIAGGVGVPAIDRQWQAAKSRFAQRLIAEELNRLAPANAAAWDAKQWQQSAARCEGRLEIAIERLAIVASQLDLRDIE